MRRSLPLSLCCLATALAIPAATLAAIPSPTNSTLPACMALCPMGDMPFTVIVRDIASNPVGGSTVVLDFLQCPGAHLCDPQPTDPYTTDPAIRTLRATTNAAGSVQFPARVGGTGGPGSVRVYADGVLLRTYALASPDQDGDGFVFQGPPIGNDVALFSARLGTADPTADFNCDGVVDQIDQNLFYQHYSQSCLGYIDAARKSTWGEIKTRYR